MSGSPNTLLDRLKGLVWGSSAKRKREEEESLNNFDSPIQNQPKQKDVRFKKKLIEDMNESELHHALSQLDLPTFGNQQQLAARLRKAVLSFQTLTTTTQEATAQQSGIQQPTTVTAGATSKSHSKSRSSKSSVVQAKGSGIGSSGSFGESEKVASSTKNINLKDILQKKKPKISKSEYDRLKSVLKQGIRSSSSSQKRQKTPVDVLRSLARSNSKQNLTQQQQQQTQPHEIIMDGESVMLDGKLYRLEKPKPAFNKGAESGLKRQRVETRSPFAQHNDDGNNLFPANTASPFPSSKRIRTQYNTTQQQQQPQQQQPQQQQNTTATQSTWRGKYSSNGEVGVQKRSDVAQRILETLGKMSTPLEDVRSRRPPSWATPSLALESKTLTMKQKAFQQHNTTHVPQRALDIPPVISNTSQNNTIQQSNAIPEQPREVLFGIGGGEDKDMENVEQSKPAMTQLKQHVKTLQDNTKQDNTTKSSSSKPAQYNTIQTPVEDEPKQDSGIVSSSVIVGGLDEQLVDPRFMFTPPHAEPEIDESKYANITQQQLDKFVFGQGRAPPLKRIKSDESSLNKNDAIDKNASVSFTMSLPTKPLEDASSPRVKPVGLSFSLPKPTTQSNNPGTWFKKEPASESVESKKESVTNSLSESSTTPIEPVQTSVPDSSEPDKKEPVSSLFAKFLPAKDTWKCNHCLTTLNPESSDKCLCCELPREDKKTESSTTQNESATSNVKVDISLFGSGSSDNKQNAAKPQFNFGGTTTTDTKDEQTSTKPAFSFGTATKDKGEEEEKKPAPFLFGVAPDASENKVQEKKPVFAFGKSSDENATKQDTQPLKSTAEAPPFKFGDSTSSSSKPLFEQKKKEPEQKAPPTLFGQTPSASTTTTPPFTFGQAQPNATTTQQDKESTKATTPGFTFGAPSNNETKPATQANATGGFKFGGSESTSVEPPKTENVVVDKKEPVNKPFVFGQAENNNTTQPNPAQEEKKPFVFGASSTTTELPKDKKAPDAPFKFGASENTTPATTQQTPFKFGASSSAPQQPNTVQQNAAQPSTGGFTFGAGSSSTTTSTAAPDTGGFKFGASSTQPTATQPPKGGGIFGAGAATPSNPATQPAAPVFGGTTTASTGSFAFGANSATDATQTQQNKAPGFTFGTSTTTTQKQPAFGGAATPFGNTGAPQQAAGTPFGAPTPTPFGQPAAQANPSLGFGQTPNPFAAQNAGQQQVANTGMTPFGGGQQQLGAGGNNTLSSFSNPGGFNIGSGSSAPAKRVRRRPIRGRRPQRR